MLAVWYGIRAKCTTAGRLQTGKRAVRVCVRCAGPDPEANTEQIHVLNCVRLVPVMSSDGPAAVPL